MSASKSILGFGDNNGRIRRIWFQKNVGNKKHLYFDEDYIKDKHY